MNLQRFITLISFSSGHIYFGLAFSASVVRPVYCLLKVNEHKTLGYVLSSGGSVGVVYVEVNEH